MHIAREVPYPVGTLLLSVLRGQPGTIGSRRPGRNPSGVQSPVPPVSPCVFPPYPDAGAAARGTPFAVPSGGGEGGVIDARGRVPDGKVRSRRRKPSSRIAEYNTPSPIKRPWLITKPTTSQYVAAKESNPDQRNRTIDPFLKRFAGSCAIAFPSAGPMTSSSPGTVPVRSSPAPHSPSNGSARLNPYAVAFRY